MIIKGYFFDLDGTLVDTHEANYLAYRAAVKIVTGINLGAELKDKIKAGYSSSSFLPSLMPTLSESKIESIINKKKDIYPDHVNVSELNIYLAELLERLSTHYVTVLVTTAKRRNAIAVLEHHNISKHFSHMVFGEDVEAMKPSPQAYNLALKKSGLNPDEVLAFEDSLSGIEAAEAAGIRVVQIRDFL